MDQGEGIPPSPETEQDVGNEVKIKPAGKVALLVLALGVAGGLYMALKPERQTVQSVVPLSADLPTAAPTEQVSTGPVALPSVDLASPNGKPEIRAHVWAWNSQMGKFFANGGPQTTEGSLMDKQGVRVRFIRQDNTSQNQAELIAFAKALQKGDPEPSVGVHFVSIMGDASAQFVKAVNDQITPLKCEIVSSNGYSRGEDKFMGLPSWKEQPQNAKGALVAAVLRDGDWNIVVKWAADNGLKVNPDERTYDPEAINWLAADDYLKAAEAYITGVCEERDVVKNGKRTGSQQKVCVNGVTTWTPGDVNVATRKGGLVSIVSTKEYRYQMPEVTIGIDKWNQAHSAYVASYVAGILEGGAAVRSDPKALQKAAEISAQIYKEENAAYWKKYFKVREEEDATGMSVELGGSSVNTLADNEQLFGLAPGSSNIFGATYTIFANIVKQQYPSILPEYPPVEQVVNTQYIKLAALKIQNKTKADLPRFEESVDLSQTVSKRAWTILFDSGKATITPASRATLQELTRHLEIAGGLAIRIEGHTDSQGDPTMNRILSQARAEAVRDYLMGVSTTNFPAERFVRPVGYGQDQPVAPNYTEAGRAQNRRVVIALGNQ